MESPIIIIGAGAAGLMTAAQLAKAGKQVLVLEARDRIGGRIYTLPHKEFHIPAEAGAEFIHGKLELTNRLLKEANILSQKVNGNFWQVSKGKWKKEEFIEDWSLVVSKLKQLKYDIPISEFLEKEFSDPQYESLRTSLKHYVEGYDAADTKRASSVAFREELENDEDQQFRVKNGYSQLAQYLSDLCLANGGIIQLSQIVNEIHWSKKKVKVITVENHQFNAEKICISVPLGILQAEEGSKGTISFYPQLQEKQKAASEMGFGAVIKNLLFFKDIFWESSHFKKTNPHVENIGFIFSKEAIPTWWTQLPSKDPMLTGWLAGPRAEKLKFDSDDVILEKVLDSLSSIFSIDKKDLEQQLIAWKVFNWTTDPFTRGAYSYATVGSMEAGKILRRRVEDTLFFAGEATEKSEIAGTVEVALISGMRAAHEILATK